MKKLLLAVSVIALTSGAAFAADLAPAPVEPVAPVYVPYSWTGFYVGAQGGYQWSEQSGPFGNFGLGLTGPYEAHPDGAVLGGFAGYNYQFNSFVVGAEGDINALLGANDKITTFQSGFGPYYIHSKQTYDGAVRLRLGYALDRLLPYIAGGVAFTNLKAEYSRSGNPPFARVNQDRVGWTIGAGVEYAFTDHIIGRLEYRYSDYGTKKFAERSRNLEDHIELKTNSLLAGISYKF